VYKQQKPKNKSAAIEV